MTISNEEKQNLEEIVCKIWKMPIEKAYKKLPDAMNYLQAEEKLAISFYTEKGEKITNPYLRFGKPDTDGITEAQANLYTKTLSKSLNKLPNKEGTFFRRIVFDKKADMKKLLIDYARADIQKEIYTEKSFFSTSINDSMLREYPTDIGIIVHGKRGKNIEQISQHPEEREILFDKKTSLRIVDIQPGEIFLLAYRHIKFIVETEEI